MRTFIVGEVVAIRKYGRTEFGVIKEQNYTPQVCGDGMKYFIQSDCQEFTGWYTETQLSQMNP